MKMRGICAVLCLTMISAVDVCDAECDEYFIVFEEITCPNHVKLTPLKSRDINWDKVTYPCNSTDKNTGKKKCIIEFDCLGTQATCLSRIKILAHQSHSFIDNHTAKLITSTTEALDVPKPITNITVEDVPKDMTNITLEDIPKDMANITLEDIPKDMTNITLEDIPKDISTITVEDVPKDMTNINVEDVTKGITNITEEVVKKSITNITVEDVPKDMTNITVGGEPKDMTNITVGDEPKDITNITVGDEPKYMTNITVGDEPKDIANTNVDDVPKGMTNITIEDAPKNITNTNIEDVTKDITNIIVEDVPKDMTNISVEDVPKGLTNITVEGLPKYITNITEEVLKKGINNFTVEDVPNDMPNITVQEKPHHTVNVEFNNTSTYDVNIMYIKENVIQNRSKTTSENFILYCDYAETVCIDGGKPENYSLSDVKNVNTFKITINRDKTSPVQPLFTGYFPDSSGDSSTNYKNSFKDLKTVSLSCSTLKHKNCKQNIENKSSKQINVYVKANYIENNTITKYPACAKNLITSENVLNLKCEHILFAKNNPHIVQTPPTPPPKQELSTWHCEITKLKTLSSKKQRIENSKLHFINCSRETKIGDATPNSESKAINMYNILTKSNIEMNKTEISSEKKETYIDHSPQTNPENIITILITEKPNNCSNDLYFNINEGKVIDLGINNNKDKLLQTNNVELILSDCLNVTYSTIIETQPHPKLELIIILKNESLNTLNLKHFNGTPEDVSVKQRILLRCDPNLDLSRNKTILQCESIDFDLYYITGIEITPLSQTARNETAITSKNITKKEVSNWNCQILESNDTLSSKEQEQQSEISKLYFKNCTYNVNMNDIKNRSGDNNVTPISDGQNRPIDSVTTTIPTIDSTKDTVERKKTEMPSVKLELTKNNLSHRNPENMIKIFVTEKQNNCSNNSLLNIDEGKIIDLRSKNNKNKFLENNIVELKLTNCVEVKYSIKNETQPNSKVELTIILNNESINDSNLKQFNGTAKMGNVKQRILLRCDQPYLDSNDTELQCETIDLDLYNITGIEISTHISPTSNAINTKEKKKEIIMVKVNHNQTEISKNNNFSTNKPVANNESTVNSKTNENNIEIVQNKEVQKSIPEGNSNNPKVVKIKEVQKKVSESVDNSKTLNFNRKKDIPNGAGQNSLALGNPETEKILLIALLTVASVAILIVIALRACPKKQYSPAPTREPPDEEETAF